MNRFGLVYVHNTDFNMSKQSTTPLGFMDTYAVQVINETGDEKIACWDIVGKPHQPYVCAMGAHRFVSLLL